MTGYSIHSQDMFLNKFPPLRRPASVELRRFIFDVCCCSLGALLRGEQRQTNSDGVADPLIKLINFRQVTRRHYGRRVNSNVSPETSWADWLAG